MVIRTEDLVASPDAMPDKFVAQEDVLEQLQHDMKNWPRAEREVFELCYVKGLDAEEIALVRGQPLKTVQQNLASVQQHICKQLLEQEAIT